MGAALQGLFGEPFLKCKTAACLLNVENGNVPQTGEAFGVNNGGMVAAAPCENYVDSSMKAVGHACIKFRSRYHSRCTCNVEAACETGVAMPVDSDDKVLKLTMEVKEGPKPPVVCNGEKMSTKIQKCGSRCDLPRHLENVRFVQVPLAWMQGSRPCRQSLNDL